LEPDITNPAATVRAEQATLARSFAADEEGRQILLIPTWNLCAFAGLTKHGERTSSQSPKRNLGPPDRRDHSARLWLRAGTSRR
jgi:hypothetical protein